MTTAIYSTEPPHDETPRDIRPATLTVNEVCGLLRLAPTAVPVLAERGDLEVWLPPARPKYCPRLDDVRIVRWRGSLRSDTTLLDELRAAHPPQKRDIHLWRVTALGGVLRVLGR